MKLLNANKKGFASLFPKKTTLFLVLILLLVGIANAECTDTDGGRNYGEKGDTKIVSGKEDICVLSPSAEVRQDISPYLKEYYCDNNDQIDYEIIECIREGFEKCEMGKCVGGEAEAKSGGNYTPPPPEPSCGNMIVDPGEECDPMNKMCFDDDGNIGLCNENCLCEVKIRLDGSEEPEEENETEDTEIEEVEPVEKEVEEQEEEEIEDAEEKEEEKQEITVTIAEKHKKPAPKGFFARIWVWIAGLFS